MAPQVTNRSGWHFWGLTIMIFCFVVGVFLGWFAPGAPVWSWKAMFSLGLIALTIGVLARKL